MTERFRANVRSAVRSLAGTPGPVLWAVVMLAVAVGLNLAMFGLIDRALLSPPAHVADPARVFTLAFQPLDDETGDVRMTTTSYPSFDAIRRTMSAASAVAAWQRLSSAVIVDSMQISADVMLVSDTYFQALGTAPRLGRAILPGDDDGGVAVAILSHAFWTSRFGGNPAVLGTRIVVRGTDFTVAGVMPAGFSGHSAARVDMWIPMAAALAQDADWQNPFRNIASVIVRLKPDQQPAVAARQATDALTDAPRRVSLTPIGGATIGSNERRIAYWLTGVSVLVLVIGLANTATLLLVRNARRRRDWAIRTALGATRAHLLAQVLIEAVIIAVAGVAVALLLDRWLGEVVRGVLLPSLIESPGLSVRVAGAAALAGVAAFVVAAAAGAAQLPAAYGSGEMAGIPHSRPRRHAHIALLVVQTTLSIVLLIGAGVFGRSLYNLSSQDFGMRVDDLLLVEFEPGPGDERRQHELFAAAIERVRALPGVLKVAPTNGLPFAGHIIPPIGIPGRAEPPNVNGQLPYLIPATPDLLDILDIRVTHGRRFTPADERGPLVVIVNESMAQAAWPGESALGKCIRIGFDPSFDPFTAEGPPGPPVNVPCREVIGVARDVRQRSVIPDGMEERLMQYFVPFSQIPPPPVGVGGAPGIRGLLVRTTVDAGTLSDPIRRLVTSGRTDLPFLQVRPYAGLLERQMRPWRLGTILLSLFGALAVGVAAMGLYAAFTHVVHERRREMAIRIAIGATPSGVLRLVLREAAVLALVGAGCGTLVAAVAGRWVQSMLFGTVATDPLVLGASASVMLTVAVVATFVPALSAARTDPNAMLRAE